MGASISHSPLSQVKSNAVDSAELEALNTMFGERVTAHRRPIVSVKFIYGLLNADVTQEYCWDLSAGAFTVGHLVDGGTSGATGIVVAIGGGMITIRTIHLAFDPVGEVITEQDTAVTGSITPAGHGRASTISGKLTINSGTDGTTRNCIPSRKQGTYVAGFDMEGMSTWAWLDGGLANTFQFAFLLGNATCGIGVGFDGLDWGVVHRMAGVDSHTAPNLDPLDGSGPSKMVIDTTKINIFRVGMAYLGVGGFLLRIWDAPTRKWVPFHFITRANVSTMLLVDDPHLGTLGDIKKTGAAATNVRMISGSWSVVVYTHEEHGNPFTKEASLAYTSGAEKPVLTIKNPWLFNGVANRVPMRLLSVSMGTDGTKQTIIRIRRNALLTGSAFAPVEAGQSAAEYDATATAMTNGHTEQIFTIESKSGEHEELGSEDIIVFPGESVTFSGDSPGSNAITIAVRWREIV